MTNDRVFDIANQLGITRSTAMKVISALTVKVYIINEPLRFDTHSGKLIPMYDLSGAEKFGELVYVLPRGNNPPKDPDQTLPFIKEAMRKYTKDDYIVAVGHIELFSWATALAVQASDGVINQLKWDNSIEQYVPRRARLW